MKGMSFVAGIAGLVVLLTGSAFADPTYSIYSVPQVSDGGMIRYGLNDLGSYVGWTNTGGTYYGFWNGPDGSMTPIDPPGATNTYATSINNNNVIVGFYSDSTGTHGFMDAGGKYTALNAPGAVATYANSVNNLGQVVGYYVDANGVTHGFVEYGGTYTSIDVPGAVATYALSINQRGEIVGSYFDGTAVHGFIYHNGSFQFIDYPDATVTWLTGVNDDGTLIGWSRSCDTCESNPFVKLINEPFTLPGFAGLAGLNPTGINDYGLDIGYGSNEIPTTVQKQTGGGNGYGAVPEPGTTVLVGAGALVLMLAKRLFKKA